MRVDNAGLDLHSESGWHRAAGVVASEEGGKDPLASTLISAPQGLLTVQPHKSDWRTISAGCDPPLSPVPQALEPSLRLLRFPSGQTVISIPLGTNYTVRRKKRP